MAATEHTALGKGQSRFSLRARTVPAALLTHPESPVWT
jgi:hypothetical protein